MSTLIVQVVKISSITNHPNADKLDICKFEGLGWEVIAQKGLYHVGQKVIYCPIDAVLPIELSDAMDITKYLSKQRVRTAKLRGIYSQGVIIPLYFLDEDYPLGTDVKEQLGILKYEPPPPPPQFAGQQLRQDDRFHRYTDVENIKNYPDIFMEGEDVVISEKIHGCLQSEAKILLADGSVQKIKYIVKNKLKVDVVGRDDKGNIVPSKITNWFTNGSTNDWYKVTFTRKGLGKGNAYGSLITTKNHLFFCPELNDFLPAIELKPDMDVLCSRYTFDLTYQQEQILKVQKIINIEKIKSNDSRIRYDIETETGNFFANYVLVHNSNFRCGWVDKDTFLAGSHNCNLKENEDNIYWQMVHKYNLKEKLKNLIGTIIYGEVFGPGIQKKFDYGRKEVTLAIFDIFSHNMYLNYTEEMRTVVNKILQLPLVPVLYEGVWKPDLLKLAEGKSALSNMCIKEGIIIRPVPERYDSRVGRVIFKHISEKYLLKDYGDMH